MSEVYVDPRTGLRFENESIARSLGYGQPATPVAVDQPPLVIKPSASSPGGMDYRLRDANGMLITNQYGSQFWMNEDAVLNNQTSENDPTLAVKAQFSDATVAAAWMSDYTRGLIGAGVPVSANVADMARRPTSPILQQYEQYNATPQNALSIRLDGASGTGSPVSPTVGTPVTPASVAANPAVNTGSTTTVQGAISALMGYSVYILLAVTAVIAYLVWRRR